MAVPTSSSKAGARVAALLGLLSTAAVPAGVAAAEFRKEIKLLEALVVTVPAALVLGLASIAVRRSARRAIRRSVRPDERPLRLGKWLGWLGVYLGLMGGLALAFYAVLRFYD